MSRCFATRFRNKARFVALNHGSTCEDRLVLVQSTRSALSDICKHSPELAQTVGDAGLSQGLGRNTVACRGRTLTAGKSLKPFEDHIRKEVTLDKGL